VLRQREHGVEVAVDERRAAKAGATQGAGLVGTRLMIPLDDKVDPG